MLVEKHRPRKFEDIIGQSCVPQIYSKAGEYKQSILEGDKKKIDKKTHLLFFGPPGVGKTATAECLARYVFGKDYKLHFFELNASDERGIKVVREKIKKITESAAKRIIFLSEADNMTQDAQGALRRIMETKSKNTTFILDANNPHKIIGAIKSRCADYFFHPIDSKSMLKIMLKIIKSEKIDVIKDDKDRLIELSKKYDGDVRKTITMLEQMINFENKVFNWMDDLEIELPIKSLMEMARDGNFNDAKDMIEIAFIDSRLRVGSLINEFYKFIPIVFDDIESQINLYEKLQDTARDCEMTRYPIIPLVGFIARCWLLPHLKE